MNTLSQFISKAGVCAVSGTIAGAFAGGLFGLFEFVAQNQAMPRPVLIGFAIGLSVLAWIVVLTIVGVFGNYGVIAIARQTLVTSGITGLLTVFLVYATRADRFGILLGWIIGFLVGKALCKLCDAPQGRV